MPEPLKQSSRYMPGLDGLRAVAVAAVIAYLTNTPASELSSEDDIERMLRACVDNGALDGAYARPVLSDDGVPLRTQRAFATMLREIITIGQSNLASPGH